MAPPNDSESTLTGGFNRRSSRRVTPAKTNVRFKPRARPRRKPKFVWKENDWNVRWRYEDDVHVMRNKTTPELHVVRKRVRTYKEGGETTKHMEVRALEILPNCNLVAGMLAYEHLYPDNDHGTIFFHFCPLGDMQKWKQEQFDAKNFKPVPEAYIWRFFDQMSQALAFVHNEIGPNRESRRRIIHRDIKPQNILVVNNGTTYPSFKLNDLGCATFARPGKDKVASLCGTYEWQPPENPFINTPKADVWGLGACVNYLAVGRAPLQSTKLFQARERVRNNGAHPPEAAEYKGPDRYYAAKVQREVVPINLTQEEQWRAGIAPHHTPGKPEYNPVYSDELNKWLFETLRLNPSGRPTALDLTRKMIPESRKMLRRLTGNAGLVDLDIRFED